MIHEAILILIDQNRVPNVFLKKGISRRNFFAVCVLKEWGTGSEGGRFAVGLLRSSDLV